jgi:hypothetical protein
MIAPGKHFLFCKMVRLKIYLLITLKYMIFFES